jgi:hypothetical protein
LANTRVARGSCCRPMVPGRTRLSAPLGRCMTSARATIRVNACKIWWSIWSSISTCMAFGNISCLNSITTMWSPPRWSAWPGKIRLSQLAGCPNLIWTDLDLLLSGLGRHVESKLNPQHPLSQSIAALAAEMGFRNLCAHAKNPDIDITPQEMSLVMERWGAFPVF